MKSTWCFLYVVVLAFSVGCQGQEDIEKEPLEEVHKQPDVKTPVKERIEISDLMDALGIYGWKASVNRPGRPAVKRVSLCVKHKGKDPQTIGSVDLCEDGNVPAPGKLLVFLREPDVKPGWYWIAVSFHADSGDQQRTAGWVEDPFTEKTRLQSTHPDALVGSTGFIALRDYLPMSHPARTVKDMKEEMFGLKDIGSDKNAVAIYLKNE